MPASADHTAVSALTLIAGPGAAVTPSAAAVRSALEGVGATIEKETTLAPDVAIDFIVRHPGDRAALADLARDARARARVDVAVQAPDARRKGLLIADMDSTIIEQECIDELAAAVGKRHEIAAITERAMRGELDFEAALKTRVAALEGLDAGALERTFAERITLTPGARTLVKTMSAHGAATALISGGFTFFTERVAAAAGFQRHRANILLIANDRLTGAVAEPILGRDAKKAALMDIAAEAGLDLSQTLAVGDGANDLAMIARAGLGVAFHAKPAVAAAADVAVDHGDLTALLYMQGYTAAEFVAG